MPSGKHLRRGRRFAVSMVAVCATLAATASAALADDYTVSISPASVPPGATAQTFIVQFNDTSSKNPLNAATITSPGGFTLTAASLVSPSGNATVQTQGAQVLVKGLSLKQGQSAAVKITANTPNTCGQVAWTVRAFKSSLNGPALAPDPTTAQTSLTEATCPVAVKFANQPSNAYSGQTISSSPFNPTGPPVTVDLVDASGHIATGFSAPVTIALGANPGGSTLSGNLTVQATNGMATFSDLSLNKPGAGYTLVASSPGLTNDTSSPFGVNSQTTQCPGGDCGQGSNAPTLNSPPGSPTPSSITVTTTPTAGASGTLNLSVDDGTKPACNTLAGGTYQGADQNFYGVLYTPDPGTPQVAKTATYTIFNTGSVPGLHLCFAAPYPFELLDNSTFAPPPAPPPGTLPDGSPGYVGLLVNCANATIPGPCQTSTVVGSDTVFTINIPAGEPGDPYFHG